MERPPIFPSRRARDLTGLVLLLTGLLTFAAVAIYAAFAWQPLAGAAVVAVLVAGVGYLLGRE